MDTVRIPPSPAVGKRSEYLLSGGKVKSTASGPGYRFTGGDVEAVDDDSWRRVRPNARFQGAGIARVVLALAHQLNNGFEQRAVGDVKDLDSSSGYGAVVEPRHGSRRSSRRSSEPMSGQS